MIEKIFWVYILLCQNNSYYTGYTTDLKKRYAAHLAGTASKYTASFKPICIVQAWTIDGEKALAMQIERYIKSLSRAKKEEIIKHPLGLSADQRIQAVNMQDLRSIVSF